MVWFGRRALLLWKEGIGNLMNKKQIKKELYKEMIKTVKYLNFLVKLVEKKVLKKGDKNV